ncbi:hypothetical protein RhiJN_20666 [Ceratobasidium sp. AG-Ba]|nr:hypothetical protein RhiJN_20666 [Ceratobasidium sp. AG-Ba]
MAFAQLFASMAACDTTTNTVFTKTDYFVTVGCALAALLSSPAAPLDAAPEPLTIAKYRHVVELLSPTSQFEDIDAQLEAMHKTFDDQFNEGLRTVANDIRSRRRAFRLLISDWESADPSTRGPEPPAISIARDGALLADTLIQCFTDGLEEPSDVTRGKLTLLVIEKMGLMGLAERSKASKDDTFKATRMVLEYYKVL